MTIRTIIVKSKDGALFQVKTSARTEAQMKFAIEAERAYAATRTIQQLKGE